MEKFFMNAAKIEQLVTELKDEIYTKLHHRTLLEYTGQPPIWEDQLFYLLLPKFNGEQWTEQHQIAAQSVAMIQTALTTHDLVKEHMATSKEQQLMVLAGDYYSGMYYSTLATLPNVQFVRELSDVVAEISEKKTALYEADTKDFLEWVQQYEVIVSKAVEQFMKHFKFTPYIEYIKMGMLIERLSAELRKIEGNESTIRFAQVIAGELGTVETAVQALKEELNSRILVMKESLESSTTLSDLLKNVIQGRIEALVKAQHMTREG